MKRPSDGAFVFEFAFHLLLASLFAAAVGLGSACGSSSEPCHDGSAPDATPPITVAVHPATADVLTCSTLQLSATVTGSSNTAVTWKVDGDARSGRVDLTGLYTAPNQVPTPDAVSVTATSVADPTKSASSALTLWTALPQPAVHAGDSYDTSIFHHQMAASGSRAYVVLPRVDKVQDTSAYKLQVAASSDGGKTFGAPVVASDLPDPTIAIDCPAIAVDAGDASTVYVSYLAEAGAFDKTSQPTEAASGMTLVLAVSTDGAAHFTNYVLESHVSGWGECPDVASPKPGAVVVEAPAYHFHDPYLTTYADASKGAGFATGTADTSSSWLTSEAFPVAAPYNDLGHDGGSFGMESPRLVTDGKGTVCVTYVGYADGAARVAAQCSSDAGKTFGAPVEIAVAAAGEDFHHPSGVFAIGGALAVAYWKSSVAGTSMHLALSGDGGKTFAAPITLPRYALPPEVGLTGTPQYPALAWQGSVLWLA